MRGMSFEQWRATIERDYFIEGTPEWKGFQGWLKHLEAFKRSAASMPNWDPKRLPEGHPFKDPKTYILRKLYYGTLIPAKNSGECNTSKRQNEENILKLENLTKHARSQIARLTTDINEIEEAAAHSTRLAMSVVSQDEDWEIDIAPLVLLYKGAKGMLECAVQQSSEVLGIVGGEHVQEADIVDHCLGLIVKLKSLGVLERKPVRSQQSSDLTCLPSPSFSGRQKSKSGVISEPQVLALVYAALLAHGHDPDELDALNPAASRYGNVRRRLDTRMLRAIAVADKLSALVRKK
jgi:hypothetical protein